MRVIVNIKQSRYADVLFETIYYSGYNTWPTTAEYKKDIIQKILMSIFAIIMMFLKLILK